LTAKTPRAPREENTPRIDLIWMIPFSRVIYRRALTKYPDSINEKSNAPSPITSWRIFLLGVLGVLAVNPHFAFP
jgi:hypothetical protein